MSEREMFALLMELWRDLRDPGFLWQVMALAICLLLAWALSRYGRQQAFVRAHAEHGALRTFGTGSLKRVAFPLLALIFVLIVRKAFRLWHFAPVSLFDLAVPLLLSLALVRAAIYILRHAFSGGSLLASSERFIATAIWICLALHISGLADPIVELLEQVSFHAGKQKLDLWTLLTGLVTVCVTVLVALWLSGEIERRLLASENLDANMRVVLGRLVKAVLSVVALLLSLSIVGIDVTALSVFSGALAVGLGLGLQKIASNYVSGFIILLDRSIRIGNVVAVDATTSGVVTQITARYTVVRTLAGTEVIIPNEYLVSNIVRNESFTDSRLRVAISVQVAYGTDLDLAMRLMREAAQVPARVLTDPPPQALLTTFADSGINLDLGFWIADPQQGTGSVRSEINMAIWRAFREHDIEIPFPQREVRVIGASPATAGAAVAPPSAV
ncbi:mechanosensitive ion channel domain-containing protein [Accumulibacter sp.]|jgi:small-conductance mechanosensitive channel|uniref:MscS Mechanosensitive ion channel n=1 Tax=Accumulibacter regalis TaxID=522306 RepID=C7RTF3_ACCRE|nr:mechanosensitive ion channel domain-containing protein [Accumulibacter sp.]MBN8496019.1 mechanosensitive ion channel [Accumulibacter sp.]MBO3716070.1 mechanosensitive ion channel [Accumulibacter sp.]